MEDEIRALGLIVEAKEDGMYIVTGDDERLKRLRIILDIADFTDDTLLGCRVFGFTPAKETISRILICASPGNTGYIAIA